MSCEPKDTGRRYGLHTGVKFPAKNGEGKELWVMFDAQCSASCLAFSIRDPVSDHENSVSYAASRLISSVSSNVDCPFRHLAFPLASSIQHPVPHSLQTPPLSPASRGLRLSSIRCCIQPPVQRGSRGLYSRLLSSVRAASGDFSVLIQWSCRRPVLSGPNAHGCE